MREEIYERVWKNKLFYYISAVSSPLKSATIRKFLCIALNIVFIYLLATLAAHLFDRCSNFLALYFAYLSLEEFLKFISKNESNCSHTRNYSTLTDTRCYMGTTLLISARTTIASQASHTLFAGTLTGCIITWLARWSNCVTWTCYIFMVRRRNWYKLWGPLLLLCDYR